MTGQQSLVADGNSVLLVDHDTQILREADWLIEMGPGAGADGGRVIAEGPIGQVMDDPAFMIALFLKDDQSISRKSDGAALSDTLLRPICG